MDILGVSSQVVERGHEEYPRMSQPEQNYERQSMYYAQPSTLAYEEIRCARLTKCLR